MLSVRPKVAELAFHVFSRTLHPELYTIHKTRMVNRGRYQARIDITNCGHVVTWNTLQSDSKTDLVVSQNSDPEQISDSEQRAVDSPIPSATKVTATVCEVATAAQQPLPKRRRLLSKPLKGSRTERVNCRSGVNYRTHFQLEPVNPDLFWMMQQQLGKGPTEGLLHNFDPSGRMALGALSYVSVETRQSSMLLQAIHTFPDDYAIVKVESLFSVGSES